jgi:hypothetical protein
MMYLGWELANNVLDMIAREGGRIVYAAMTPSMMRTVFAAFDARVQAGTDRWFQRREDFAWLLAWSSEQVFLNEVSCKVHQIGERTLRMLSNDTLLPQSVPFVGPHCQQCCAARRSGLSRCGRKALCHLAGLPEIHAAVVHLKWRSVQRNYRQRDAGCAALLRTQRPMRLFKRRAVL